MIRIRTDSDIDSLVKTFKKKYNKLIKNEGKRNEPRKSDRKGT